MQWLLITASVKIISDILIKSLECVKMVVCVPLSAPEFQRSALKAVTQRGHLNLSVIPHCILIAIALQLHCLFRINLTNIEDIRGS